MVILSDFDGADETTRQSIAAIAAHNTVVAVLVHDPLQSEIPEAGRMIVTDGELQIVLDVSHGEMRRNILEMSQARLRSVFAWTHEFGVPVLPLSTAEIRSTVAPSARSAAAISSRGALQRPGPCMDEPAPVQGPVAGLIDIPSVAGRLAAGMDPDPGDCVLAAA